MPYHKVKQGECLLSIASFHGMTWKHIWQDENNSKLRKKRGSPNILLPGDSVYLPEFGGKQIDCSTEQTHKFQKIGTPARLILRLKRNGKVLGLKPYTIVIDGESFMGETDSEGRIEVMILPIARKGKLMLNEGSETYELILGDLDPSDQVSGVQARLHNLGFAPGPIDGILGPLTKAAVRKSQQQAGVKIDGIVGPETRGYLENEYGC